MRLNKNIIEFIARNYQNNFLAGLITFTFPQLFLRSILENNLSKQNDWRNRKCCLTISFDCDHPQDVEAFPELLKILKEFNLKTSFAVVGYWIEKYPDEHKMVVDHGHEIVNHTYSHPDNEILNPNRKFTDISYEEKKEEIARCHEICQRILKAEPIGCRIPHFNRLFTPDIYSILKDLGYKYSSSTSVINTLSHGLPFTAEHGIVEIPLSTCPKHPFTVFDTWHSFNAKRWIYKIGHRTEEQYWKLFRNLIKMGIETSSYINIYIDPKDVFKMKMFREVLSFIKNEKDICLATYQELIEKHLFKEGEKK